MELVNDLFCRLNGKIKTKYTFPLVPTSKHRPLLNKNSSVGEQVKYYRAENNLKQKELSDKLNSTIFYVKQLENRKINSFNFAKFNDVIDKLDINNKLKLNDDYISFVLNNYGSKLLQIRKENKMSRLEFAKVLNVSISSIKRWELELNMIQRCSYNKLKNYFNTL